MSNYRIVRIKDGLLSDILKEETPKRESPSPSVKNLPKKEKKLLKRVLKSIKKDPEYQKSKGFMKESSKNLLLFDGKKYSEFTGKLSKKKLAKLGNDDTSILIDLGNDVFKKISFKVFKLLSKVNYIIIDLKVIMQEEEWDIPVEIDKHTVKISNMGDLFKFFNNASGMNAAINLIYRGSTEWFSTPKIKVIPTVIIYSKKNTIEKLSSDKFVRKYIKTNQT